MKNIKVYWLMKKKLQIVNGITNLLSCLLLNKKWSSGWRKLNWMRKWNQQWVPNQGTPEVQRSTWRKKQLKRTADLLRWLQHQIMLTRRWKWNMIGKKLEMEEWQKQKHEEKYWVLSVMQLCRSRNKTNCWLGRITAN